MELHERIKQERKRKGLSQLSIALSANINQAIYSKIERGIIKPSKCQLEAILLNLGKKK